MHRTGPPVSLRGMLIADTLIGLISPLVVLWLVPSPSSRMLLANVVGGQFYAHSIGTLAHYSMTYGYPRIAHWQPASRWLTVFAILATDAAIGCLIAMTLMTLLGYHSFENFARNYWWSFRIGLIITIVFGVSGAAMEAMRAKLNHVTRQRERALQLATEARLSSLESRVHPHFLFNALNSISSLVREDPDRAERLIERMAALLRFSLDSNQLGFVTLAQEIEMVRGYLEIEKARFGDRLRFSIDIPAELNSYLLPPLSVQSLVENSVKYAIAPKREGGAIAVSAALNGGTVEVEVWDEGPGVDLRSPPPGHGLDLLQSRLQTLYGDAAQLRAEGSAVTLSVPCSAPTSLTTKS